MPEFIIESVACLVFAMIAFYAASKGERDGLLIAAALSMMEGYAAVRGISLTYGWF